MKHVTKGVEPNSFVEWKGQANAEWQPTYANFQNPQKQIVKTALLNEQGFLCGYCESRLQLEDSHIEHIQPQANQNGDDLSFSNMLCSCQSKLQKGEVRHCGGLKGDWYDAQLFVSPFDPSCETRFVYTGLGEITPTCLTDVAASTTIEKLGLNLKKLVANRKQAIAPFLNTDLSDLEAQQFIASYLERDSQNRWNAYWTTIRHLFSPPAI
jgi:uncharacterized protein (TIGR02646 family)